MCPPEDIPALRQRFGERLRFNGPISKKTIDEPADVAYRLLDQYLEQGVDIIKFCLRRARPGARPVRGRALAH